MNSIKEAAEILGVNPNSSADVIELAYRKLIKKLHPDHGGSNYLAIKINAARDLLINRLQK